MITVPFAVGIKLFCIIPFDQNPQPKVFDFVLIKGSLQSDI